MKTRTTPENHEGEDFLGSWVLVGEGLLTLVGIVGVGFAFVIVGDGREVALGGAVAGSGLNVFVGVEASCVAAPRVGVVVGSTTDADTGTMVGTSVEVGVANPSVMLACRS